MRRGAHCRLRDGALAVAVSAVSGKGIPEIVDLDVLAEFRRRGAGSALMDHAEQLLRTRSTVAGISVGLHAGYGAPQRLYAKRGYVPDGRGLWLNDHYVEEGEYISVGDEALLYLTKAL